MKSADAFRTIREVAEWLDTPTHVLRFWESRFAQIKPVKRAGGRRYYRPQDMQLLGGIKKLLHDDGMTIKSVQKMLRQDGIKHVAGFSRDLPRGAAIVQPDVPADPADDAFRQGGLLSEIAALPRPLTPAQAEALRPIIARLEAFLENTG